MTEAQCYVRGHWPDSDSWELPSTRITYPGGTVELDLIDPAHLRQTVATVRRGRRHLERWSTADMLDLLDTCAAAWCDPTNEIRQEVIASLGVTTGGSQAMLSRSNDATW